tara:strand:- start:514 stop:843 length:330 start_codon:yes stop_codon:yes gene_type:complete
MKYKYDEIKSHFEDYLDENLEHLKDDKYWKEDLHHNVFNTDYYIIGRHQAKQWLGDEVFECINIIKDYEQDNFGEVTTDFTEPEHVVNMYAYIIGEEIVQDYLDSIAND